MPIWLERAEQYFDKHERHVSSLALVVGFVFDSLTLKSPDLLLENLTILSYLVISGGSILLINYFSEKSPQRTLTTKLYRFLPVFMQFSFGGLFSAYFIFYSRSGTLGTSWLFIFVLLMLLIGNEFFKDYYQRLTFQVSILFIATFSFLIFLIPVLMKSIGAWVFLLSGVASLVVIFLFSKLLFRVVPNSFTSNEKRLRLSIGTIFVVINILYFSNLIPPIPLALKDVGVYHSITRIGEDYLAEKEVSSWNKLVSFFRTERVHVVSGGTVSVFTSVFAPTDLDTTIVHNWQYFDEDRIRWVTSSKIPFSIRGGRREGYRGFTEKGNLTYGKWRVNVETKRGQVIGQIRFDVEEASKPLVLRDVEL
jgi:hypothetical protein